LLLVLVSEARFRLGAQRCLAPGKRPEKKGGETLRATDATTPPRPVNLMECRCAAPRRCEASGRGGRHSLGGRAVPGRRVPFERKEFLGPGCGTAVVCERRPVLVDGKLLMLPLN